MKRRSDSKRTVIMEMLFALVPYTRQNMLLTFKPNKFFGELEHLTGSSRQTLSATLTRSQKQGLTRRVNGVPQLTEKGRRRLEQTLADRPMLDHWLMVVFDIPESIANTRHQLQRFLVANRFKKLQRSVYVTKYDFAKDLSKLIRKLKLQPYVQVIKCQL